jgi:Flp pilus assembly pilin Flp
MRVLKAGGGQAMAEYVMILCLVALVCLGGSLLLGKAIRGNYKNTAAVYSAPIP